VKKARLKEEENLKARARKKRDFAGGYHQRCVSVLEPAHDRPL